MVNPSIDQLTVHGASILLRQPSSARFGEPPLGLSHPPTATLRGFAPFSPVPAHLDAYKCTRLSSDFSVEKGKTEVEAVRAGLLRAPHS